MAFILNLLKVSYPEDRRPRPRRSVFNLVCAVLFCQLCLAGPSLAEHGNLVTRGDSLSKNQFLECDSNEVIKGIICADEECDRKQLECEVYAHEVDTTAEIFRLPKASSEKYFLNGIHDNDEKFNLQFLSSAILTNSGDCEWLEMGRESQDAPLQCKDEQFASGFACEDDDCDVLRIYCCESELVSDSETNPEANSGTEPGQAN